MSSLKTEFIKLFLMVLGCAGFFVPSSVMAEKSPRFYVGVTGGGTHVQPRVNTPNGVVTDNKTMGYKLFLGYHLKDREGGGRLNTFMKNMSVEAFYADLGDAAIDIGVGIDPLTNLPSTGLSDSARYHDVNYKVYGLVMAKRFPVKLNNRRLNLVAKLGLSNIKNSSTVKYRQVDPWGLFGAVGVELELNKRISVHAEFDYYDTDAHLYGIGMKVNLGK